MEMETRRCTGCHRTLPLEEFTADGTDYKVCNRCREKSRRRRENNLEIVREQTRNNLRSARARAKGIDPEEAARMATGPCDGCGTEPTERANSLYANRRTGLVTGVVCQRCATALGFLGHNPDRLRNLLTLLS